MHNGGDRMELFLNDKEICVSRPRYTADGVISGMSVCDTAIPVKKGDKIVLETKFDEISHPS